MSTPVLLLHGETELVASLFGIDKNGVTLLQRVVEQQLRDFVLNVVLQGSLQRACAVLYIVTLVGEELLCLGGEFDAV